MTEGAPAFILKAREPLAKAKHAFDGEWADQAGRLAYLAGFQAAMALILDRTGRIVKTYSGARSEFARLVKDDAAFDADHRRFLGWAYTLKNAADYATGRAAHVSNEEAIEAMAKATRLVDRIETALGVGSVDKCSASAPADDSNGA